MRVAVLFFVLPLGGCASSGDYNVYVEAQRSLSRDATVVETGRIAALVELSKSHPDPQVRLAAINALVQMGERARTVNIESPRRSLF